MNDSNICIGTSKELDGLTAKGEPIPFVPKVDYSISKKTKQIIFTGETYFELYDTEGKLVEEGYGKIVSFAGLEAGNYSLNYDNSTTAVKLK